jgi:hypothetical protein
MPEIPPQSAPQFTIPPVSPDEKPQSHKSFLARHLLAEILGLALAGAALAGGYWYYISNLETAVFEPIHREQIETYTNAEYGFEFKHPATWSVTQDRDVFLLAKATRPGNEGERIILNVWPNQGSVEKNLEFIKLQYGGEFDSYRSYTSTDNWQGRYRVYPTKDGGGGPNITMFMITENNIMAADGGGNPGPITDFEPVFFEILSTFKFIEPQACIQVITRAKNAQTGEEKDFPTPCDVPIGWVKVQ